MATAKITSKGQVTIPKSVREHLGLQQGDRIDFEIVGDARVVVRPVRRSVEDVFGMLRRSDGRAVSLEEMDAAIARATSRRGV